MNEELQNFLLNTLKASKDFVISQAPDVVQQYIAIQAVDCLGWVAIFATVAIFTYFVPLKKKWEPDYSGDPGMAVKNALCYILILVMSLGVINELGNFLEVKLYPKGYMLQQLSHARNNK